MAISGDLRALGTFASYYSKHPSLPTFSSPKTRIGCFTREPANLKLQTNGNKGNPLTMIRGNKHCCCFAVTGDELAMTTINQDSDGFLLNAINKSFFEQSVAWRILFPTPRARRNCNAKTAKRRLKMILFSDCCAVSVEAKQKIVSNIVQALSDFVEIDSQEKVQLSFSGDPDFGAVYSVTIPVWRAKPEYQESDKDFRAITSMEYKSSGEASNSIDVKLDLFVPNEKWL